METGLSTNLRTLLLSDAVDPLDFNERVAPASNVSTLPVEPALKTDFPTSPYQFVVNPSPSLTKPHALSSSAGFCSSINSLFSIGSVSDTKSPVTWRSSKYEVSSSADSSDSWVGVAGEGSGVSPRVPTLSRVTPLELHQQLQHHRRSHQVSSSVMNTKDYNSFAESTPLDTSVDVAAEGSGIPPRAPTLSLATPLVDLEEQPPSIQLSPFLSNIKRTVQAC